MKVAIIGGIGSGKSEVRRILNNLGKITLDSDSINAELLETKDYIQAIDKAFKGVVKNGKIDKKILKEKVFSNDLDRKKLNDLAHPLIRQILQEKLNALNDVYVEVPLLTECNMQDMFDRIWLVKSNKNIRKERVLKRDNINEELFYKINESQASEEDREKVATDTIYNDSTLKNLEDQIVNLL